MIKFFTYSSYYEKHDGKNYFYSKVGIIKHHHLNTLFNHYCSTGVNALDAYINTLSASTLKNRTRDPLSSSTLNYHYRFVEALKKLDLRRFDGLITKAESNLHKLSLEREDYLVELNKRPRIMASKYISKKEIRKLIFDFYGKVCLACGSDDRVSLDHVVAVANKGKNEITNLQPLCFTCNTRKQTKTIDYRTAIITA